jgi:hypothetical protein
MKYLLILFITFFSISGKTYSDKVSEFDSIYFQILKNKPTIDVDYAGRLSYYIVVESHKFGVSPRLFTAMLMQESGYRLSAKNCTYDIFEYEKCTDYGISQIHVTTVTRYKFNQARLTSDLVYSLRAGLRVLSDFKKRYGHKDRYYWTRYNSSDPIARLRYKEKVMRWL